MHRMNEWKVIYTIQGCALHCEHMIHYFSEVPDRCSRFKQLRLLRDCADICTITAQFITRNCPYSRNIAHTCALICEACAKECSRFPDPASQMCARICLHCAKVCRHFTAH